MHACDDPRSSCIIRVRTLCAAYHGEARYAGQCTKSVAHCNGLYVADCLLISPSSMSNTASHSDVTTRNPAIACANLANICSILVTVGQIAGYDLAGASQLDDDQSVVFEASTLSSALKRMSREYGSQFLYLGVAAHCVMMSQFARRCGQPGEPSHACRRPERHKLSQHAHSIRAHISVSKHVQCITTCTDQAIVAARDQAPECHALSKPRRCVASVCARCLRCTVCFPPGRMSSASGPHCDSHDGELL